MTMPPAPKALPPSRGLLAALVACLCASAAGAQADIIRPKRGNPVIGKIWEETAEEVVYNLYRTGLRQVTRGTEKFPVRNLKEIQRDPDPHREFWTKFETLARDGSADAWVELGLDAKSKKLATLAERAFIEALARDGEHAAARKKIGSTQLKRILAGDPRLNPTLKEKLDAYLPIEDPSERMAAAKEIAAISDSWPDHLLERARRSHRQPKGLIIDQLLTLDSESHPEAVYTLFVPASYNPFVPTPLVVGLHGGGPGGKDRTGVVGSGPSTMNFYQDEAARLGWIVLCPTALRAPWAQPANDGFVMAAVAEVAMLYNIDRHRIYLAGHSMGGYGAWHFGPKFAETWAAISPNAGGGSPSLKKLGDTATGVYCYHGADDNVVGPSSDRALAEQMLKSNMDFVYCEIPDSGHGWPNDVRREMFDFFQVRRLGLPGRGGFRPSETVDGSFAAKPGRAELEAFGPLFAPDPGPPDVAESRTLLQQLQKGGGRAQRAAARIAQISDAKLAQDVAKVLLNPKSNPDVRRFAAEALGEMGQEAALRPLRRALADESERVMGAAAVALGRLKDPEAAKSFDAGVQVLLDRFEKKKSGREMSFWDFDNLSACAIQFATGMGGCGEPACAPALHKIYIAFLDETLNVPATDRAGQDASRPRRALAKAILDACRELSSPLARPTLEGLAARSDLGVATEAASLLSGLSSN